MVIIDIIIRVLWQDLEDFCFIKKVEIKCNIIEVLLYFIKLKFFEN